MIDKPKFMPSLREEDLLNEYMSELIDLTQKWSSGWEKMSDAAIVVGALMRTAMEVTAAYHKLPKETVPVLGESVARAMDQKIKELKEQRG